MYTTNLKEPKLTDYNINENSLQNYITKKSKYGEYSAFTLILLTLLIIVYLIFYFNIYVMYVLCIIWLPYIFLHEFLKKVFYPFLLNKTNFEKYLIAEYEYNTYKQKLNVNYWHSLSGYKFEEEVTNLLIKLGLNAKKTKGSNDGGIDIILYDENNNIDTLIQCKAHKKKLSPATARELYGVMKSQNIDCGLIICLGGFSNETIKFANSNNIRLWDVNDIIKLSDFKRNEAHRTDIVTQENDYETNYKLNKAKSKPPHIP